MGSNKSGAVFFATHSGNEFRLDQGIEYEFCPKVRGENSIEKCMENVFSIAISLCLATLHIGRSFSVKLLG